MSINNSQNSHTLAPHCQSNVTVEPWLNIGRLIFYGLKWNYRDVYWDNEADRYRDDIDGRFVSDWKGNLFA